MKKSIMITALAVLLSTGLFAYANAKETTVKEVNAVEQVSFAGSKGVSLNINAAAGSMVRFYDENNNLLLADRLTGKTEGAKAYNLGGLENGVYTVKVSANNQELTKKVVVYEDGGVRSFFIVQ